MMSIFIWLIYTVNGVAAFFAFIWAFNFLSKHNFVAQFTSRSQRYRKTGMELGCMELTYRLIFSALPAIVVLMPSILIYDSRSEEFNLSDYFVSDQERVEPLSAEELSEQLRVLREGHLQEPNEEANKSEMATPRKLSD